MKCKYILLTFMIEIKPVIYVGSQTVGLRVESWVSVFRTCAALHKQKRT
jgi:hypothetical protein